MTIKFIVLLVCLLVGCSKKPVEPICVVYEPVLNQSLEPYTTITPVIDVKVNGKLWQDWGNGTNLSGIDNPIFFQARSMIRYQRCTGQTCGQEVGEFKLTKSEGVTVNESSHLESFQFIVNLPDTVITSLRNSKRGQLIYMPENILENDQICQFKEEITGLLFEDDEYYGRYRLDSTKPFTFSIAEFNPEQQVMSIKFNGTFWYDKTNVDPGFLIKANRLYEPNISLQIYTRFRYSRQNES